MKRTLSFVMMLVLCISMLSMVAFAAEANTMTLSVSSATAKQGETVSLTVKIDSNTGAAGISITPKYDANVLTLTSMTGSGLNWTIGRNAFWSDIYNSTYTGTVLTLNFTVKEDAAIGDSVVTLQVSAFTETEDTVICTVNDGTVTVEKTPCSHSWSAWEVTTAATCTKAGEQTRTCSKCQETETETIAATGHTEGKAVKENEKAANCTEPGSYDEVVSCTVCKEELSRETKTVAAIGHAWGEWLETIPATCTETGVNTRLCANDETHQESQVVPATGHTKGEAVKENEVAPTCTEAGSYDEVVSCTVCKEELSRETKTVAATGHTAGEAVKENEVAATCTEAGSYDEVVYCSVCKEELSRETKTVEALGHEWEYTKDEEGHEATCTACQAVMEKTAHAYENNGYCECGHKDPNYVEEDPGLDDVPSTGDITPMIVTAVFAMVAMVAAAAYMLKRKFAV